MNKPASIPYAADSVSELERPDQVQSPKLSAAIENQAEATESLETKNPGVPDYLKNVYQWAYLDPRNAQLLDRELVVNTILWGNSKRLRQAVLDEISAGDSILQAAHVYGDLIPEIAAKTGSQGNLDVVDIAPLQASLAEKKLAQFTHAKVRIADASQPSQKQYDLVNCFFLLHEVPDDLKVSIVHQLLKSVKRGGKAIFVDYHKPELWHPLQLLMRLIFKIFEPFATSLWGMDIAALSNDDGRFTWSKKTYFGGLYQVYIAERNN
jgi:SAM-dependent methyltransferase